MNSIPAKSTLILFTSNYPFGKGEVFLEKEVEVLATQFESIIIVSSNTSSSEKRKVPSNVETIRHSFKLTKGEKLKSLLNVFGEIYKKEHILIKEFNSSFYKQQVRYLLSSLSKGKKVKKFISSLVKKKEIRADKLFLYSYWWLDESIGIALYKKEHSLSKGFTRCHGYDVYTERSACAYLPLKQMTIQYLDRIYGISEDAKQYIIRNYSKSTVSEKKVIVSKLGVGNGELKLLKKQNENNQYTVVSCSSIYPNKRVELIMHAVLQSKLNVKWIHIGGYIKNFSENYYNEIVSFSEANQSAKIQIEFAGNKTNHEILDFYKANDVDLFVNASESEGISVAIMEAMSYSIPVIATNVGGTPELVNEKNGFLVDVGIDATTLQSKIDNFLNLDIEAVNKLRQASFMTVQSDYNAESNYNKFVTEIAKISN